VTPPTSSGDAAWLDPAVVPFDARSRSRLAHPAGKGRDDQAGIEEALRAAVATGTKLPDFDDAVFSTLFECADLLISKQKDYGPDAINLSPGGALVGINVRMHDKMMRAQHLRRTGAEPNHESLVDTYRDLANYAVIAVMVLEGTWPQ
jgi:hypothetical protein